MAMAVTIIVQNPIHTVEMMTKGRFRRASIVLLHQYRGPIFTMRHDNTSQFFGDMDLGGNNVSLC